MGWKVNGVIFFFLLPILLLSRPALRVKKSAQSVSPGGFQLSSKYFMRRSRSSAVFLES